MKLVHLFSTIKMMHAPINLRSELLSYREIHPVNPVVSCNDLFILRRFSKAHLDCNLFPVTSKVISRPSVNFQRRDMSLSSVDSVRRPASGVRRPGAPVELRSTETYSPSMTADATTLWDAALSAHLKETQIQFPEISGYVVFLFLIGTTDKTRKVTVSTINHYPKQLI